MALDARVCCNCIRQGATPPHPFPELLAFDETAEPILKSNGEISLDQWLKHDAWYRKSCPHAGRLIKKRLGNIALVGHVRDVLESIGATAFPVLGRRVVYDDTHGGDWIVASDSVRLLGEAQRLRQLSNDSISRQFASDLIELAVASAATGNPIVFG